MNPVRIRFAPSRIQFTPDSHILAPGSHLVRTFSHPVRIWFAHSRIRFASGSLILASGSLFLGSTHTMSAPILPPIGSPDASRVQVRARSFRAHCIEYPLQLVSAAPDVHCIGCPLLQTGTDSIRRTRQRSSRTRNVEREVPRSTAAISRIRFPSLAGVTHRHAASRGLVPGCSRFAPDGIFGRGPYRDPCAGFRLQGGSCSPVAS